MKNKIKFLLLVQFLLRDQDFVYDATSDVLSFKNMQGNNWIIQHTKNIFNKNYEKIKFQA